MKKKRSNESFNKFANFLKNLAIYVKQNWCPSSFEMSNIRVKIELLLAAYYAVFPVCFKSQRNMLDYDMWQCSCES